MKDELQKEIITLITGTVDRAKAAEQFILAETPEYIQQLLRYEFVISLFGFIVGITIFAALFVYARWLFKALQLSNEEKSKLWYFGDSYDPDFLIISLTGFFGVIFFLTGFFYIKNLVWMKILIAPKVYLVEYAMALVK